MSVTRSILIPKNQAIRPSLANPRPASHRKRKGENSSQTKRRVKPINPKKEKTKNPAMPNHQTNQKKNKLSTNRSSGTFADGIVDPKTIKQFLRFPSFDEQAPMLEFEKSVHDCPIQPRQQGIKEAINIENPDRLGVIMKLGPGEDFKEL